jgi:histidine ammonia-lyase
VVGGPGPDRWLAPELAVVDTLVREGVVVDAVETVLGPLR